MNNDDLPPALRGRGSMNPVQSKNIEPRNVDSTAKNDENDLRQQALRELEAQTAALEARKNRTPSFEEDKPTVMPSPVEKPVEQKVSPQPQPQQVEQAATLPPTPAKPISSGGLSYTINGDDIQYVEIILNPNDSIICDESYLMYYEDGIKIKSEINSSGATGLMGKMLDAGKAAVKGGQAFITTCSNSTSGPKKVAFSNNCAGKIVALDIGSLGSKVICQTSVLLCASRTLSISAASPAERGASAFSKGADLSKFEGRGLAFISIGGCYFSKILASGEKLHASSSTVIARQGTVGYEIKKTIENNKTMVRETLTGPGSVWLQSLPFNRTRDRITSYVMNSLAAIEKKKKK